MPMWERCRYCGCPTTRDDLQCDECAEWDIPASRADLRHAVARWSLRIEGWDVLDGRPVIEVIDPEGRL